MPTFHQNYWMGLKASQPQKFSNIDVTMPNLTSGGTYKNWGRVKSPAGGVRPAAGLREWGGVCVGS